MKNRKDLTLIVSLLAALALFAGCTAAAAAAPQPTLTAAPTEAPAFLTLEEAKAIAYAHAGVAESEAADRSYDFDDGAYEIEFDHGGWEYDYRIAPDGTIVKSQKTPEPAGSAGQTVPAETKPAEKKSGDQKSDRSADSGRISAEQALSIALNHAGVSNPRDKDVEWDDGRWEVSFESGRTEYEYKISASGSILRWEKDYDN